MISFNGIWLSDLLFQPLATFILLPHIKKIKQFTRSSLSLLNKSSKLYMTGWVNFRTKISNVCTTVICYCKKIINVHHIRSMRIDNFKSVPDHMIEPECCRALCGYRVGEVQVSIIIRGAPKIFGWQSPMCHPATGISGKYCRVGRKVCVIFVSCSIPVVILPLSPIRNYIRIQWKRRMLQGKL